MLEKELIFWLSSLSQNHDIKKSLRCNYFFLQVASLDNLGKVFYFTLTNQILETW